MNVECALDSAVTRSGMIACIFHARKARLRATGREFERHLRVAWAVKTDPSIIATAGRFSFSAVVRSMDCMAEAVERTGHVRGDIACFA